MPPRKRKSVAKTPSRRSLAQTIQNVSHNVLREEGRSHAQATTRTVVTEQIIRTHRVRDRTPVRRRHSVSCDDLETWDLSPKTDYTYVRSPTYSRRFIGESWVWPNMSRPRLRNGAPLDISPALSATDRRRQLRRSEPRPLVAADPRPLVVETEPVRRSAGLRQTTLEESYIQRTPARRQDDGPDDDTYSPMAAPRTLPASVTRSGRRENPPRSMRQSKRQSTSQCHDDVTDLSMAEYMQLEKRLEYSGTAGPYKEASRLSLYGLDLTEDDDVLSAATDRGLPPMSRLSDHSSSRLTGHSSSQESVTSYTRSIIVSLLTLITTILQSTWYIVTCPVRWVLSIGSTREDYSKSSTYHTTEQSAADFTNLSHRTRSGASHQDNYSDDDDEDITGSAAKYAQEDSSADNSVWTWLLAVVYILCVHIPVGVGKGIGRTSGWIYKYIILSIVDVVKLVLRAGYSLLTLSFLSSDATTTASTDTATVTTTTTTTESTTESDDRESEEEKYLAESSKEAQGAELEVDPVLEVDPSPGPESALSSACSWLLYLLLTVVYLVCVQAPAGLATVFSSSVSWIYTNILLSVVDIFKSVFHAAKSLVTFTAEDSESGTPFTTTTTTTTVTTASDADAWEPSQRDDVDTTRTTRTLRSRRSQINNFSDDEEGEQSEEYSSEDSSEYQSALSSLCSWISYPIIALVYLLCVAVPAGLAKVLGTVGSWLYTYLLSPILDVLKAVVSLIFAPFTYFGKFYESASEEENITSSDDNQGATRSRRSRRSTAKYSADEEDQELEESEKLEDCDNQSALASLCDWISYPIIMLVYLLCVALPTGIARVLRTVGFWLYDYILSPVAAVIKYPFSGWSESSPTTSEETVGTDKQTTKRTRRSRRSQVTGAFSADEEDEETEDFVVEDSDDDEKQSWIGSLCSWISYPIIMLVYLLCVALPTGIAQVLKTVGLWMFDYILYPVGAVIKYPFSGWSESSQTTSEETVGTDKQTTKRTRRSRRSQVTGTFSADEDDQEAEGFVVEDSDDDEKQSWIGSLCSWISYPIIMLVYLLCVALPTGIGKSLKAVGVCLYDYILHPVGAVLKYPFSGWSESYQTTSEETINTDKQTTKRTRRSRRSQVTGTFSADEDDQEAEDFVVEDSDDDDKQSWIGSLCSWISYPIIMLVYLLCVALPTGVAKVLGSVGSWLYAYVLSPIGNVLAYPFKTTLAYFSSQSSSDSSEGVSMMATPAKVAKKAASVLGYQARSVNEAQDKSWCSYVTSAITEFFTKLVFGFLALLYLLFVVIPVGLAKSLRSSVVWLFTCLLLPVVDGAKATAVAATSLFSGGAAATSQAATSAATTATHSAAGVAAKSSSVVQSCSAAISSGVVHSGVAIKSVAIAFANGVANVLLIPFYAASDGGAWCCRVCVRLGGWLHQAIARVVLLDTWMLSRSGDRRGSRACCCWWPLLLLLLLLPFLLVPGSRYFIAPITTKEAAGAVPVVGVADSDKVVMTTAAAEGIALRELIEKELVVAKADLKSHDSALYQDNLAHMTRLETQLAGLRADIATLEDAQTALVARLAGCCKNDSQLAGLVKTGVTEQLATIMLGGGAAGSADPNPDSSADGASTSAFAAWLNGQFARPGDFDAKIAALTETLNKGLREQAEANRQAALLAAGAQATADGAVTEAGRAAGLAGALRESQDTQSSAWTQDKDSLSALVAGVAGDMKARDDQLAGDVAAAAALAATAAGAAQEAKVLAAEVKAERVVDAERETVVGTEGTEAAGSAAGVGIGVGTGCGCDSKTFVIPDTYQAITEEQVKLLIREALGIFGADKTGMVDYALESAGGSVISTRCSETFHRRTAQLSLFGIPLWYTSNSPRTVIQPEVHPGQCWAFRGTQGYLVVQLAGLVRPTAFSLEHIPKVLSPSGQIDSAPKAFSVWGLKHERDVDGTLFGNYTYLDNNEPLQFFPVADSSVDAFHIIELRIHGNHGNQDYTCLYRFRVHGVLKRS